MTTNSIMRRLADCRAYPRDCGVNHLVDRYSACKTGCFALVSATSHTSAANSPRPEQ